MHSLETIQAMNKLAAEGKSRAEIDRILGIGMIMTEMWCVEVISTSRSGWVEKAIHGPFYGREDADRWVEKNKPAGYTLHKMVSPLKK